MYIKGHCYIGSNGRRARISQSRENVLLRLGKTIVDY